MRTYENRYYQQFLQEINFDMLMITFIEPFAHYHRNIASDINYQLSTINYQLSILLIGYLGTSMMHQK
jgi:hypothetical protein